MTEIKVYTDGACSGNPGPGGWAVLILREGKQISFSGHEEMTTNNRMELMAAIKAIEKTKEENIIALYTDSKYVKDGITTWINNWKKNGWRTANKKSVKNMDLWQRLDEVALQSNVEWHWVKGHSGDKHNDLVDELAVSACRNRVK